MGVLDSVFGVKGFQRNGVEVVTRKRLDVRGAGLSLVDDPATETTVLVATREFILSAEDYGVAASNPDNTAALQAAANAAAGGVLQLPGGVLRQAADVSYPSNIEIRGTPSTWLTATNDSVSNPLLVEVTTRTNVKFVDVGFDGALGAAASFNSVVVGYRTTGLKFLHCRFRNMKGIASLISQCNDSGFFDCEFENCGIYNRTSASSGDRRAAIAFSGDGGGAWGHGNFAFLNRFKAVGLDCISATNQRGYFVDGNRCRDNDAGTIYVSNCSDFRVHGNNVSNGPSGGNAIDIADASDGSVVGNVCHGNGAAGILLANVQDVAVGDNVVKNNFQSGTSTHVGGITLSATSGVTSGIALTGNRVFDDQGPGSITQRHAIGIVRSGSASFDDVRVDESNVLTGYTADGYPSVRDVFQNALLGVSGSSINKRARSRASMTAAADSSTTITTIGCPAPASDGTPATQAIASTSFFTRQARIRSDSAASAGANFGHRARDRKFLADAGRTVVRFGVEQFQSGMAAFVGQKIDGAHGDVNPSTFLSCIGIGIDAGQTTWRLIHADVDGPTIATDLGANFPADSSATDWYELEMWWGDAATSVFWSLTRLNTGHRTGGQIYENLPLTTATLVTHVVGNTRAGSSVAALSWASVIHEVF